MIAWKSRLKLSPSISPSRALTRDEPSEQRLVVRAGGAVGVAGQVRALRQLLQPAEHAERGVVHDIVDVRAPPALVQLERQQRQQRVDRADSWRRRRVAGRGDQTGQVELDQLGHQQEHAGVLAGSAARRASHRRAAARLGRQRRRAGRAARRLAQPARPSSASISQIAVRDSGALAASSARRSPPASALPRNAMTSSGPVLLGLRAAAPAATMRTLRAPGAIVPHHRLDRRGRVTEALSYLLRRCALDEVRAQRLVAALVGLTGAVNRSAPGRTPIVR